MTHAHKNSMEPPVILVPMMITVEAKLSPGGRLQPRLQHCAIRSNSKGRNRLVVLWPYNYGTRFIVV